MLFRNNGDGTFTDVSAKAGIAAASGKGLGVAFADYDRRRLDGRLRRQRLGAVVPVPQQRQRHVQRGRACSPASAFNEDGKTFAGMGVDFADYDNDGHPDVIVTDLSNERYRLFRHNGDGSFRDVTNAVRRRRRDARLLGLEHAVRSTTTTTAGRTSSSRRDT